MGRIVSLFLTLSAPLFSEANHFLACGFAGPQADSKPFRCSAHWDARAKRQTRAKRHKRQPFGRARCVRRGVGCRGVIGGGGGGASVLVPRGVAQHDGARAWRGDVAGGCANVLPVSKFIFKSSTAAIEFASAQECSPPFAAACSWSGRGARC